MAISRGEFLKNSIANDKVTEALQVIDRYFKDKYAISTSEVLEILEREELSIPLSVFSNTPLSSLEIIVRYLKETLGKTYHETAELLNRDDRTVWSTYNNSLKKYRGKLKIGPSSDAIPLSIFADRKYSVLESIVVFLKNTRQKSFNEIAEKLKKNYQTIWTTYRKAQAKDETR
ncbi:MAG: hypothetical protein KKF44_06070 [Nanoarchaeota archaeon]|nr:hypothetical protein [Nanoarchaeota archaeon]